jgi:archaellum biogenesis ATPase FlaH
MTDIHNKEANIGENKLVNPSFVVTGKELYEMDIKEMPWLIEGVFGRSGLCALGGSSDMGKSTFLRQLAISVAMGDSTFLEWKLNLRYKKVLYISTEDEPISIAHVIRKQFSNSINAEKLENIFFIFGQENLLDNINELLVKHNFDIIIVDAFSDVFIGDMNNISQVRSCLNKYNTMANNNDVLILFLHHTGKRTESLTPSKSSFIGSQGFEAKMRMVAQLTKDPFDIDARHFCIVKGNFISEENKNKSFKLNFKDLIFSNTNERVPFGKLAINPNAEILKEEIQDRVCDLSAEGNSIRQIEDIMKSEGYKIGKTKVSDLKKECPDCDNTKASSDAPVLT